MKNTNSIWTPDNVAKLLKLRSEGFTARQIAEQIGPTVTKNAVIGRVHRMGMLLRSTAEGHRFSVVEGIRYRDRNKPRRSINGRAAKSKSQYLKRHWLCTSFPLPEETDQVPSTAVTFAELQKHHCRYPFGHSPSIKYCGQDAVIGSYCHHHHLKTHR